MRPCVSCWSYERFDTIIAARQRRRKQSVGTALRRTLLVTLSIRFSRNPVIVDIDRVGSFGMGGWQQL
jgi:hypothetical protein